MCVCVCVRVNVTESRPMSRNIIPIPILETGRHVLILEVSPLGVPNPRLVHTEHHNVGHVCK